MSYSEAFAHPRLDEVGVRYGAATPRRHNVTIRATGAKEIRVTQVNNGGSRWLGFKHGEQYVVKTVKKQKGRRADSPAKLKIRVFWKAGGNEWFTVEASGNRTVTLIPGPGMAGTDAAPGGGGGNSGGGGSGGETAASSYTDEGYTEGAYQSVDTPWATYAAYSLVAASVGFLSIKLIRG